MRFAFKSLPAYPRKQWVLGIQRRIDHLVDTIPEAVLFKSHPLRQRAKELDIGSAFAKRRNRLSRGLQVIVPVSSLQICVLKKCGRGQDDVRVVSRVCPELLVNHGEEIRPPQSPDDLVVIGTNGRWIRVVNKQSFHWR